jgi:flagellar biosynthesis/type III secretory pathway chaperone
MATRRQSQTINSKEPTIGSLLDSLDTLDQMIQNKRKMAAANAREETYKAQQKLNERMQELASKDAQCKKLKVKITELRDREPDEGWKANDLPDTRNLRMLVQSNGATPDTIKLVQEFIKKHSQPIDQ